jgi:hypothetical protein
MSLVVNGFVMLVTAIPFMLLLFFWMAWGFWAMFVALGWACQCAVATLRK